MQTRTTWSTMLALGLALHSGPIAWAQKAEPGVDSPSTVDQPTQVTLQFRSQTWLQALQWLASELKLNLDWQTLPEGDFSFHSTQAHTLEEAEDLINMQLLARGFTLLKRDEVLRLVPLKEIDITLVPHVEPEDLAKLGRHQFVRVSFPLEWMIADEAVEEFRPLLSLYGRLFSMRSTNRLEAMDAVVNLREMYRLLSRAEADDARRERVAEFPLKYRKAEEVAVKVRQLLGLPPDASTLMSTQSQLDIEQARFKVEAVKQMGIGAKELIKDKRPDVFITVNDKENSILVNAPPNKMEIARQTIEAIDKPLPEHDSSWETVNKVKVHEIEGFDPTAVTSLFTALQAAGNLSKETRIQHETAYNRIIAFASAEDHLTITHLIDSFRAKKRSAGIIPLGSLDAHYAVKAVQLILKNPVRPASAPGVASDGTFQVEADPDHNRLLTWATPDEHREVQEFLLALGDNRNAAAEGTVSNMQVIELNGATLSEVSGKLERIWKELSDSPLLIESAPVAESQSHRSTQSKATSNAPIRLIASQNAEGDRTASPVRIIEGEGGELIILSRDATAAYSAKQLLERLLPEPGALTTILLKHSQAAWIRKQVEESLARDQLQSNSKLATPTQPIKIDVDTRTNRLIIQNAAPGHLKRIKQLVEVLDQPIAADDRLTRQQRSYRFKYRQAVEVSAIVKEVYRDLLSINDRVFASSNSRGPSGFNENLAATQNNPEYQGLLSLGVDSEANMLIASAPGYLLDEVMKLVESVDTERDGNSLTVTAFTSGKRDAAAREALSRILNSRRK